MSDNTSNNQPNTGNETKPPKEASFVPTPDMSFMREKIKQKPINKGRLFRRTMITVLLAAIFGAVACITFLWLEPFLSDRISSSGKTAQTESVTTVVLPDIPEDNTDEMLPEDMIAKDPDYKSEAEALQGDVSEVRGNVRNIEEMVKSIRFGIDDYQNLYTDLRSLAEQISNSLVTINGLTEATDLLNNPYEYAARVSGVIVADNGAQLLILVKDAGLTEAEELQAVFADGVNCECEIVGRDEATGLLILGVRKYFLTESTLDIAIPATLGTSRSTSLKGTPVIALGSPVGVADSFAYGMVTSGTQQLYMTDSDYMLITTDILGTENSSGVLVSLRGKVLGLIDNSYESGATEDVVNAVGITELKPLIESLSNGTPRAYLGVQGMDITYSMKNTYGLPEGIYLREVDLDSPAMNSGVQRGDILTAVNGDPVISYHDFILWLSDMTPGTKVRLSLARQAVDDYMDIECEVELGELVNSEINNP